MKEKYLSSLLKKTTNARLNKSILRTGIENEIIGTVIIILNDLKNARMNRQAEELFITRIFRKNQQATLDSDVPGVGLGRKNSKAVESFSKKVF